MDSTNQRHLLILDLDETLLYAKEKDEKHELPSPDIAIPEYDVWKRPFLDAFIERSMDWFDVAVWTSSSQSYADAVIPYIFPSPERLVFVWTRTQCTPHTDYKYGQYYWRKNLDKVRRRLKRPLERVLIIDDSPKKLDRHYGNLIGVLPFQGNTEDTELRDILPFLDWIRFAPNVRVIEKRAWRGFPRN